MKASRRNFKRKDVLFIKGDWNAKAGSQETPGITGKFGIGVHHEARQRLDTLFQEYKRRLYPWTSPDGQ